jgi:hypothetical protein
MRGISFAEGKEKNRITIAIPPIGTLAVGQFSSEASQKEGQSWDTYFSQNIPG